MTDRADIEPHSRTWRAVKEWAEARLTSSRSTLEAAGLPREETEYERGRISALRELLGLTEPPIIMAESETTE
jgi:hypothetical protein